MKFDVADMKYLKFLVDATFYLDVICIVVFILSVIYRLRMFVNLWKIAKIRRVRVTGKDIQDI